MKKLILYIILLLHITAQAGEQDSLVIPSYPGGYQVMYKFIRENFQFSKEAIDKAINGTIHTLFTIQPDGSVTDVKVRDGLCCGLNEEAIRVLSAMPKWNSEGQKQAIQFSFPLLVKIPIKKPEVKATTSGQSYVNTIEMSVGKSDTKELDQVAEFPGGQKELFKYLAKNVNYPPECKNLQLSGTVEIEFQIEKDGSITMPIVKKSIHPAIDAEALRVVKAMPNWVPAVKYGEPVESKYFLPIKVNFLN